MSPTLAFLLVYAIALVALGWWSSRRAGAAEFFVAGRRLSPLMLAGTLVAANIGAGSTQGAAGLGYRDGLAAWWWVGAAGLGSVVLALMVGPRMWRLASDAGHRTVGDFLRARFGPEVRGLMAVLLWAGSLSILAAQLIALAGLLETLLGVPRVWGCVIGGLVATLYFTTGGLLSSTLVNGVQAIVLLVGLSLAIPFAWQAGPGLSALASPSVPATYWSIWESGASGVMYLALLGPSFVVSPGLLQKVYGARNEAAVRSGVLLNAAVLLAFAIVPPFLGMLSRAAHPALPNPELALPVLLRDDLPGWLGALAMAALFSAEVSSADAVLFMLSTSLARDLYAGHLKPGATDAEQLRVARAAAIVSGVAGIGVSIWAGSIVSAMRLFYSLLSASLFVPVIAGVFVPQAGRTHALAAMLAGVATTLALHVGAGGADMAGLAPVVWGLIASATALLLALALVRE